MTLFAFRAVTTELPPEMSCDAKDGDSDREDQEEDGEESGNELG